MPKQIDSHIEQLAAHKTNNRNISQIEIDDEDEDDSFDEYFDDLFEFNYVHGNLNKLHIHAPKLKEWVNKQVKLFRIGELEYDRCQKLRRLGVDLNLKFIFVSVHIMQRIDCLIQFRNETGEDTPSKYHSNKEYASLAQWLTRQKRAFNGGVLDQSVSDALREVGIVFTAPSEKYRLEGEISATKAFEKNIKNLKYCLYELDIMKNSNNFLLKDINKSPEIKQAYRFLEHVILKFRNGTLRQEHGKQIVELKFSMNGTEFEKLLNHNSKRPR